jgi:uncharacterized protein
MENKIKTLHRIRSLAMKSFKTEMGFDEEEDFSIHGISHWEEVYSNGVLLSMQKGVDTLVVRLFAYLHDCKRQNDAQDYFHGERAADYVKELAKSEELNFLTVKQINLLEYACANHNKGEVSEDPTIGACYDADRIELIRCGTIPNPRLMSTRLGKRIAEKMQKTQEICEHLARFKYK